MGGYQSDIGETGLLFNTTKVFSIPDKQINTTVVFLVVSSNTYVVVNGNLVLPQSISMLRTGGAGLVDGEVLKIPVPKELRVTYTWTTLSNEGNLFLCQMSEFGVIQIKGEFTSNTDILAISFPTYIAKTPIEISNDPVF